MQRHSAVMSRTDGDAAAIEPLRNIVRMDAVDAEADDPRLVIRSGAEQSKPLDRLQSFVG